MTLRSSVFALKQQFENLFPGKWVNVGKQHKTILTGLKEIDQSLTRGLLRQRITEWTGPASSGKRSLLRAIIQQWCASGFNVAYIDTENRLVASDWIALEQGKGKFWVIRNLATTPLSPVKASSLKSCSSLKSSSVWVAAELIRAHAFDVIVLDLGSSEGLNPMPGRVYAQLQNSLTRSKTALMIVRDSSISTGTGKQSSLTPSWASYAQISFQWSTNPKCTNGLKGTILIEPAINCTVSKDGLSQAAEVSITSYVANCLFTHSPVPDRRTSKT